MESLLFNSEEEIDPDDGARDGGAGRVVGGVLEEGGPSSSRRVAINFIVRFVSFLRDGLLIVVVVVVVVVVVASCRCSFIRCCSAGRGFIRCCSAGRGVVCRCCSSNVLDSIVPVGQIVDSSAVFRFRR